MDERPLLNDFPSRVKKIAVRAPGRVCLFGDHQDYLGLPIIACAINRYMAFRAIPNGKEYFEMVLPDVGQTRIIYIDPEQQKSEKPIDFFVAGLRVARRHGCVPSEGLTVTLTSDIPINAGVSSSSALVVGWIHLLLKAFGCNQKITPDLIAKMAYEAEVVEHHSPGGKMDQYTIAIGNSIFLNTQNDTYSILGSKLETMILAESGIAKETLGTLKNTRELAEKAIEKILFQQPNFNIHKATVEDIPKYESILGPHLFPYFDAAVTNHYLTQTALAEFQQPKPDAKKMGVLMTHHHDVLKNKLLVSHPKIDAMLEAAQTAGAYGGKIVGSGGGGCAVVLAPKESEVDIIQAFMKAGAKKAYPVKISNGSCHHDA